MKRILWLMLVALAPVVAAGKKPQNKGVPSFTVFHEFRNLVDGREFDTRTYPIKEKTRHGDRVYLLDGKTSTAAEALQVGRGVTTADKGWRGRFRGGLTDARGPQLRDTTAEQKAIVKELQAKP